MYKKGDQICCAMWNKIKQEQKARIKRPKQKKNQFSSFMTDVRSI